MTTRLSSFSEAFLPTNPSSIRLYRESLSQEYITSENVHGLIQSAQENDIHHLSQGHSLLALNFSTTTSSRVKTSSLPEGLYSGGGCCVSSTGKLFVYGDRDCNVHLRDIQHWFIWFSRENKSKRKTNSLHVVQDVWRRIANQLWPEWWMIEEDYHKVIRWCQCHWRTMVWHCQEPSQCPKSCQALVKLLEAAELDEAPEKIKRVL